MERAMATVRDTRVHYDRNSWTLCRFASTRLVARASWLVAVGLTSACTQSSKSPIERAEFGVLFGGQVQERTEIPFELDASKQALGFVITLSQPLPKPATLHWELSKPGPLAASRLPDPVSRRVELFDAPVAAGQSQIQKAVNIEPGDSLGLWNLRVTLGARLAIDRSFMVVDPNSRSRRVREPVTSDAGL
jgi:hypothetical protein